MRWFLMALKNYTNFSGRSQRAEYWYYFLFYVILFLIFLFIDLALGWADEQAGIGILSGILVLGLLVPTLAVGVRRLHDIGRSGWWMLLSFVPFGAFALMIMATFDSKPGSNQWGPSPKENPALETM